MKKLQIIIIGIVFLLSISAAHAQYTISVQQVGSDVVATGSGSINLTGLTFVTTATGCNPFVNASLALLRTGALNSNCDSYRGVSDPGAFGSGGTFFANSGTGGYIGFSGFSGNPLQKVIFVPDGYVSGTSFNSSATWTNQTFSSLGLTQGVYTSTWNGGTGSITVIIGQTTAASVSIGGRVLTNTNRGLANAVVYLTDSNGETRTARANPFGYYRFAGIAAGQTVVVTVTAKRYQFAPQVLAVTEEIEDLNFAAITPSRER